MADKSVMFQKNHQPKGRSYCETPGTSCCYGMNDVCVNCLRPKGWRIHRYNRQRLHPTKTFKRG